METYGACMGNVPVVRENEDIDVGIPFRLISHKARR
jgi:hypothetical protein